MACQAASQNDRLLQVGDEGTEIGRIVRLRLRDGVATVNSRGSDMTVRVHVLIRTTLLCSVLPSKQTRLGCLPLISRRSLQKRAHRAATTVRFIQHIIQIRYLSINAAGDNVDGPMYQVKLLSALRSGTCRSFHPYRIRVDVYTGDPAVIHPFLAEIGKDKRTSSEGTLDTGSAALHLAIRCASGASTATPLISPY